MIFDRRPEIVRALEELAAFTWPATSSLSKAVVRFNQSYEFMIDNLVSLDDQHELARSEWNSYLSLRQLSRRFTEVGKKRVSWTFDDAGRPAFWNEIQTLLPIAIEEIRRFPAPIAALTTVPCELPLKYLGVAFPDRQASEELSREDRADGSSIHFRHWWDLRSKTVEIFRHHGLTYPEDNVPVMIPVAFSLTEDDYNDQLFVCAATGWLPGCLDRAVLVDQYRLYLGHPDWALSIALNEDHNLLVSAEGVGAVGCEFRDIHDLDRLLACAQGMLNRLVEANERAARE
jgi:hypothetical protein